MINLVLNLAVAYFSYRSRALIPALEMVIDTLITLAIIAFLVAWLGILSARKELGKGSMSIPPLGSRLSFIKLPRRSAWRALVITAAVVLVYGGFLAVLFLLLSPAGVPGSVYIVVKGLYAAGCAALACLAAVRTIAH